MCFPSLFSFASVIGNKSFLESPTENTFVVILLSDMSLIQRVFLQASLGLMNLPDGLNQNT